MNSRLNKLCAPSKRLLKRSAEKSASRRANLRQIIPCALLLFAGLYAFNDGYSSEGSDAHSYLFRLFESKIRRSMSVEEEQESWDMDQEDSTTTMSRKQKPVMYTFYNRIDIWSRNTGMTDDGDDAMLALWKEQWTAAGFDAHILKLEDAEPHPRFAEFQEKLKDVPLNTPTKIYNQMCFIRHLAMAQVGGGFMTDYDVLPLISEGDYSPHTRIHEQDESTDSNFDRDGKMEIKEGQEISKDLSFRIPSNQEDITVYSATIAGGGIPCMMSGPASKWESLAFELMDNAITKHSEERMWTDFLAMIDLREENIYEINNLVLNKFELDREWSEYACNEIKEHGYIAVHFSHIRFKEAGIPVDQRSELARSWLERWKSACN